MGIKVGGHDCSRLKILCGSVQIIPVDALNFFFMNYNLEKVMQKILSFALSTCFIGATYSAFAGNAGIGNPSTNPCNNAGTNSGASVTQRDNSTVPCPSNTTGTGTGTTGTGTTGTGTTGTGTT
ncbi:MAG TPA: hypothetical protein VFF74_06630, partial [Methylophilaceae bacterium]|nr:hypothetical protein [Methylophilaceae bacterium]